MKAAKYPAYKLGLSKNIQLLPEHWAELPLKRLFRLEKREPLESDEIITAFRDGTVTLRKNRREDGFTNALKEIGYQRINRDDLVIHAMDAFAGAIGVSDSDGKSTPVYSACTATKDANPHFYAYYLRDLALHGFIESLAKGIRERSTDFRWSDASMVAVPVPPRSEQLTIANFLDRETAKIDALIAEQQRLIELLQEKRQAVISHAVTKGLNPNAPMKDSGVEWLGEVPEHWVVCNFQRFVHIAEGQVDPKQSPFADMPLIAPNHIQSGTGQLLDLETAGQQGAESGKYICSEGDVIYSKIRPSLRKACIAPCDCLTSADMYPLRAHGRLSNEFLFRFLLSEPFSALAIVESERVAMPKINRDSLKSVALAIPPKSEQEHICLFIRIHSITFDALIVEAQEAIVLLSERRSALISAAVTGQIDVRGLVPEAKEQ